MKVEDCVWSTESSIPGLIPLAGEYSDLEDFFVKVVGVSPMTLNLLVSELLKAADCEEKDAVGIGHLMERIGEALAADSDAELSKEQLQKLKRSQFLPIRIFGEDDHDDDEKDDGEVTDGIDNGIDNGNDGEGDNEDDGEGDNDGDNEYEWKFKRPTEEFFINDHLRYGEIFEEKVDIVDFTCAELPSLHGLFLRLNIQRRYLSLHVQEIDTEVEDGTLNEVLSARIKRRAYALSWYVCFSPVAHCMGASTEIGLT